MTIQNYLENIQYKFTQASSNKLLLVMTGIDGSLSGYKGKYDIIASDMKDNHDISTLIVALPYTAWEYMREIFDYSMDLIKTYFGKKNFEDYKIYAMGISAGGSNILSLFNEVPQIKSICVVNPVLTTYYQMRDNKAVVDFRKIIKNLKIKNVRKTIILGELDMSRADYEILKEIKETNTIVIPNGDHNLSGEENFKYFLEIPGKYLID